MRRITCVTRQQRRDLAQTGGALQEMEPCAGGDAGPLGSAPCIYLCADALQMVTVQEQDCLLPLCK